MTDPHLEHSIFGGHEDAHDRPHADDQPVVRSRSDRHRAARKPRRSGRRTGCLFVALVIVAVAAFAAYTVLRPVVDGFLESNDYPGPGTGEVQIVVNDGDTGRAIGATLEKADVVKSAKAYLDAAAADTRAASIQPGSYTMKKQMTAQAALAILVETKNRSVPRVTVREGLWKSEVFAALSKGTGVPVAEYTAAAKDAAALGAPSGRQGQRRGLPVPLDVRVPGQGDSRPAAQDHGGPGDRRAARRRASARLTTRRPSSWPPSSRVRPESPTAARSRGSWRTGSTTRPARRWGCCRWTRRSTSRSRSAATSPSPSTSRQSPTATTRTPSRGCLPGPISSPGAKAIEAAANPTEGPWFYFVTVNYDTGETLFAVTQAEHDRNNAQRQAWCDDNKPKCEGGG